MPKPVFRSAFDPSDRSSDLVCSDPSLAQQSFRDEVDINVLLERFKVTGQIPGGIRLPEYGDFTGIDDYRSALDAVRAADAAFLELPANMRAQFQNDPQAWSEWVLDPANKAEVQRLGLARDLPSDPSPKAPDLPKTPTPES